MSSQYLGQRRRDRACQSANQLILITGVISLVIMGLCILFRQGVLILLYGGVAGDVMANALVYLTISALSYPFLAVYNSCAALFRSMGNSKISMQAFHHHEHYQCYRGLPVHLCIPLGCGGCCCGFPDFTV